MTLFGRKLGAIIFSNPGNRGIGTKQGSYFPGDCGSIIQESSLGSRLEGGSGKHLKPTNS